MLRTSSGFEAWRRESSQIVYTSGQELIHMPEAGETTVHSREWSAGNPVPTEQLFELVYSHPRKSAGAPFRGERPENALQCTSVVNGLFYLAETTPEADREPVLAGVPVLIFPSMAHFPGPGRSPVTRSIRPRLERLLRTRSEF